MIRRARPRASSRAALRRRARHRSHLDDGRSFARSTERKYDLAVYALVDSLVLHSGYSSLRLENFLFTREAFEDVKRTLKPDGVFAMYNFYRQGWVVGRLAKMAEEVFGVEPLVISLPHAGRIQPGDSRSATSRSCWPAAIRSACEAIRARFAKGDELLAAIRQPAAERGDQRASALDRAPPGEDWHRSAAGARRPARHRPAAERRLAAALPARAARSPGRRSARACW